MKLNKCLYFFFLLIICFNLKAYEIGQNIYLNACGPNPQEYFEKPLVLNNLSEIPNKIISLDKSEYGREFQTLASSQMNFNKNNYKASLENFRNFKITDTEGNILIDRKVSGATSIYEITFNENLKVWGVGWHKYEKFCSDEFYYSDVDFTALRLFIPIINNGIVSFDDENVLSPSFSNIKVYENVSKPIVVDKSTIVGPYGAADLYYKAINFFTIEEDGLYEVESLGDLNKLGISANFFEASIYLNWLSRYANTKIIQEFINTNYDEILEFEFGDTLYNSDEILKNKSTCKSQNFLTRKELTQNCFPSLKEGENNQYESLIGSRYD